MPDYGINPTLGADTNVWNGDPLFDELLREMDLENTEGADAQPSLDALSGVLAKIMTSGYTDEQMIEATANVMAQTGYSAHAVAQATGIPFEQIEGALASQGYGVGAGTYIDEPDITGNTSSLDPTLDDDLYGYDPDSTGHGSFNEDGTGSGFDEEGLTAENVPDDQNSGGGSTYTPEEIAAVLAKVNSGEVTVEELEAQYGVPAATIQADIDAANASPGHDQEHPWRYEGDGTFTNVITGEAGTSPIPEGVVFVEGEQYSLGEDGGVYNEAGEQVAAVDQNSDGVNVFVGVAGLPDAFETDAEQPGTGGAGAGTGGAGGDTVVIDDTTVPVDDTSDDVDDTGGAGDGTGDGDGDGDGNGSVPTRGLFADAGGVTRQVFENEIDLDNIPKTMFSFSRRFRNFI